jgi:UDP-N-acetyl-D-glucosamine dehydrogenase
MNLEELIKNKKAKVAVIGLGYVGLPTAVELAKAGFFVFGIDIKEERVNKVNQGDSYVSDISGKELKEVIEKDKLKASSDHSLLKEADVILVCVPTPLDKNKFPDTSYIESTAEEISKYLRPGQLIILESSTYPGTTREVILPKLEKKDLEIGKDYFLAFSPERIDPGNRKYKFADISRVVGGITEEGTKLSVSFYKSFIKGKVKAVSSPETAEMTKILENSFRLVNISLVNELSLLCGKMGIDIWEAIEAAKTKPYGFKAFYPSPKIGGHCIPLDPFYLSWKAREYNFWTRFIELAGEINEQMPHYVVTKVFTVLNREGVALSKSKILVLGVSYKENIGDTRESAALDIIPDLIRKKASVDYFDPYIKEIKIDHEYLKKPVDLRSIDYSSEKLKYYDLILILTAHSGIDYGEIAKKSNLVVDTRNVIKSRDYNNVFRL